MTLLGAPVPVRTGDVSDIPHSSAHDLPQFFLGNLVDGDLDLLFILAQEEPALFVRLPAHLRVQAPVPEAAVTGEPVVGGLRNSVDWWRPVCELHEVRDAVAEGHSPLTPDMKGVPNP